MLRRDRPDRLVVALERPATRRFRTHTGRVARIAGWARSPNGRPVDVAVRYGLRRASVRAEDPRPDAGPDAVGFDLYLDLPRRSVGPTPIFVSFSDGERRVRFRPRWAMPRADLSMLDTYIGDSPAMLDLAARHLRGRGVEFGALHAPLVVDPDVCEVTYADKLTREAALETFFDMRESFGDRFVDPTIIVDLDHDDLEALRPHDFDFFIANGVIEHLANPLSFLRRLADVMRPGASFFLSVPDRDYTFDARRELTPMDHLVDEFHRDVTEVSDEHVADMAAKSPPYYHPDGAEERRVLYDFHRTRSLHVHVWDQESFDRTLEIARTQLGIPLEIVDRATSREAHGNMVYVLRRS